MARFEVDALTDQLQAVRTQQLTEAWGDHVDPSGPYNDTPGFGWLSRRLGYFTQGSDRTEGRYAPVYDHELDLKAIRMAAWLMDEEVPVAKAMKNRLVDYTIGSGFDWEVTHPSPRVQAICRRIVSSFMDNSDWTTLERESFKREIVDGEFIAEFVADGPDISMEVREGDHLTEPANSYELEEWKGYTFETCWSFGILTRKGRAAPIAYHVNRDGVGQDWDLIDADRFVHWKRNAPRNAKRGFSDHYTTHKWLKYGADVLGRTAQGTAVQASIAYIVEHAKGTTPKQAQAIASGRNIVVEKDYQTGQYVNKRKIGAGEVIDIPEGAKYHAGLLGSNASMIYIDVMEALFRLSGVVYAFPEHFVTGYAGNNNRASAEEASSPFIQGRFADQGVRKQQMRRLLLNVIKFGLERLPRLGIVYEEIEHELNVSIAEPEIVTKDPAALTTALKMQKEAGWISDRMAIQELGRDYEDVMQQRKEEAGVQPGQQPDSPADQSMAGLSRRQFMNNKKAILDIVRELKAGEIDQGQATVMLAALGLSKGLVDQLIGVQAITEAWLQEARDADGDGFVFDGTKQERAVTPEEKAKSSRKAKGSRKPVGQRTVKQSREPKPKTKAALAKASAKYVGKDVQDIGKANEYELAKQLKGEALPNSAPHDVETDDAFVEVKTIVIGENAKLTMNKYAQVLKVRLEKSSKKPFHTVVFDDSVFVKTKNTADRRMYYRRGVAGSARVSALLRVEGGVPELKKLMAMPDGKLPLAARRTDRGLFVGTWKPIKGERGFVNSKTGEVAKPKK